MIENKNKGWFELATLGGAYDFENDFSTDEWISLAHKVFKDEMLESDFLEYEKERQEANGITSEEQKDCLDIFNYLNDKKGYGDDEYIETILRAHPTRIFYLEYNDKTENFTIWEKDL